MKKLLSLSILIFATIARADSDPTVVTHASSSFNDTAEPPLACGDFLKQMGRDRPEIVFVGCRSIEGNNANDPGFEATYHVKGKHIDATDNWIGTWAKWEHLRFSCCQWDAPRGYYRDNLGSHYEVNLFVEAYINGGIMVNQRKDFPKLPYAILTITHYLYRP
ncbi:MULTISPECIES: DUF4952 domain-containing protein [Caballeronia]|jgi:hypothetical protein|uniref:DUF4952 domain-containing protein n=1 Tax=Caballeronia TaxID=1827195 RepID=UPI00025BC56D|nr:MULTISPECIES: DUF4952 domain-containing protein [Caballeronia]EKS68610.1 hypothetical protein BURK_026310 [Burkholderia sp. SJ98]